MKNIYSTYFESSAFRSQTSNIISECCNIIIFSLLLNITKISVVQYHNKTAGQIADTLR